MFHMFENTTYAPVRVFVFIACFLGSINGAGANESPIASSYKTIAKFLGLGGPKQPRAIIILRYDQRPFILHQFPSDRSDIVTRLDTPSPETRHVEVLTGCNGEWCHVRIGSAVGWIESSKLEIANVPGEQIEVVTGPLNDPEQPQPLPEERKEVVVSLEQPPSNPEPLETVNVPIPDRKEAILPLHKQSGLESEPEQPPITTASLPVQEIAEPQIIAPPDSESIEPDLNLSNITKKKYSLTRVEDMTFLPVREDPLNDAPIIGGIPFFADDVEALGVCIDDWCLVQRGETLLGWIKRKYLSDSPQEDAPQLRLQNTEAQKVIPLYRSSDRQAEIATYIDPRATGIVPVGKICDQDWCLVRHAGEFGWIESRYLARQ